MKVHPIIAGTIIALLMAGLLSLAWRNFATGASSSIPGIAIWFISIALGVWEFRRRSRQKPR